MFNVSKFEDNKTANTQNIIAQQRAENLFVLNKRNVLELCVGPSLNILQKEYNKFGIYVTGNDIEQRWKNYFPQGNWIIGNCFDINYKNFDVIVFAPPLSKNCSGKREDSLMIEQVNPSYYDFIKKLKLFKNKNAVLVLPARSISTKYDKIQYFKLLAFLQNSGYNPVVREMKDNKNIRKYIDIYI